MRSIINIESSRILLHFYPLHASKIFQCRRPKLLVFHFFFLSIENDPILSRTPIASIFRTTTVHSLLQVSSYVKYDAIARATAIITIITIIKKEKRAAQAFGTMQFFLVPARGRNKRFNFQQAPVRVLARGGWLRL